MAASVTADRLDPAQHSRRSLLRAGLAGLAGVALGALGRPPGARAAAENPIIMGAPNDAAGTDTSLNTSTTGTAFQVNQTGTGTALRGVANNGIAGFFTSGSGSGVSGVVGHNGKYGVYGANDAATTGSGAAMRASGQKNHGLVATTAVAGRVAVKAVGSDSAIMGLAAGATGVDRGGYPAGAGEFAGTIGVMARAVGDGIGVLAFAPAGTAINGQSASGYGVIGNTGNATGVYGYAVTGTAVAGVADTGCGVYALSSSGTGYALVTSGSANVQGNLSVSGTLSKGGGSFKIDHPLDPANKYLYHSFVESPDMKNVYDGVATLDANGEATIELPDWFDALNRDCRVQLTPVGKHSPLFVAGKVKNGRFSIGGGEAGQEVYWQITSIRKDAFANAHRIPIEEDKPAAERGLYLHPVEHGQPKEKGVDTLHPKPAAPPKL